MDEQQRRFEDLIDHVVPIDLTQPEEGFTDVNYGGEHLKQVLLRALPAAYRQTLLTLDEAMRMIVAQAGTSFDPRVVEILQKAAK